MTPSDATRPSLLVRIRDARDREAWGQFVEIYAPLVYDLARRRGLQDADAADLTQEVLRSVSGAIGRLDYDPARGTFRSWLFTVTRNAINTFFESQRQGAAGIGRFLGPGLAGEPGRAGRGVGRVGSRIPAQGARLTRPSRSASRSRRPPGRPSRRPHSKESRSRTWPPAWG